MFPTTKFRPSYFQLECFDGYEEDIGKTYKLIQLDNIPVPEYPGK